MKAELELHILLAQHEERIATLNKLYDERLKIHASYTECGSQITESLIDWYNTSHNKLRDKAVAEILEIIEG